MAAGGFVIDAHSLESLMRRAPPAEMRDRLLLPIHAFGGANGRHLRVTLESTGWSSNVEVVDFDLLAHAKEFVALCDDLSDCEAAALIIAAEEGAVLVGEDGQPLRALAEARLSPGGFLAVEEFLDHVFDRHAGRRPR